jgi:hypothetical protein
VRAAAFYDLGAQAVKSVQAMPPDCTTKKPSDAQRKSVPHMPPKCRQNQHMLSNTASKFKLKFKSNKVFDPPRHHQICS